jgi:hypothetical protein
MQSQFLSDFRPFRAAEGHYAPAHTPSREQLFDHAFISGEADAVNLDSPLFFMDTNGQGFVRGQVSGRRLPALLKSKFTNRDDIEARRSFM